MRMGRVEGQFGSVYRRCKCPPKENGKPVDCAHPWYYRVRHGAEELRRKVGPGPKGEKVARQRLQQIQVNLVREETLGVKRVLHATLREFWPRVEAERRPRMTPASWGAFSSRYAVAASFFGEHMDAVDEGRVREFLRWLGKRRVRLRDEHPRPVSGATRNRYLDTLSSAFRQAVTEGYAVVNPAEGVGREREQKQRPPEVSREDLDAILARCPSLRDLADLCYETGLRRNEAYFLDCREVDLNARMLWVGKAKSAAGVRAVPLTDAALSILGRLMSGRVVALNGPDAVFRDLPDPREVTRMFGRAARAANLPRVTLHKLRGSVATRLLKNGVGVSVVRDILGHSTIGVTDRYAASSPSKAMQEAMAGLAKGLREERKEATA